jgi:hypothetical protein
MARFPRRKSLTLESVCSRRLSLSRGKEAGCDYLDHAHNKQIRVSDRRRSAGVFVTARIAGRPGRLHAPTGGGVTHLPAQLGHERRCDPLEDSGSQLPGCVTGS